MKYLYGILSALILSMCLVSASSARPHHYTQTAALAAPSFSAADAPISYMGNDTQINGKKFQGDFNTPSTGEKIAVAHPAGCPWRNFCVCGVSEKIWGYAKHMAAKAFRQYPQSAPAAGTVGVRSDGHHAMYVLSYSGGNTARVYDPNGGKHGTWIHDRSIAGYTFYRPNA